MSIRGFGSRAPFGVRGVRLMVDGLPITLPDGKKTKLPALPVEMNGEKFGLRHDLPKEGQHTRDAAKEAGLTDEQIDALIAKGILRV